MSSSESGAAYAEGTVFETFRPAINIQRVVDAETHCTENVGQFLEDKKVCHEGAQVAPWSRAVRG